MDTCHSVTMEDGETPRSVLSRACSMAKGGWFVLAAMVLMTTQPFLTASTRTESGGYDYVVMGVTLLAECSKLLISSVMYACLPASQRTHTQVVMRDIMQFAVPALVYAANNNVMFVIMSYTSSTSFQILSVFKTVFTGLLFRVVLKRSLSGVQYASIILLASGAAVAHLPGPGDAAECGSGDASGEPPSSNTAWIGDLLTIMSCVMSAFAGIYSELLLKKDGGRHSLHLQNIMLYFWGVVFNSVAIAIRDHKTITTNGFFHGFAPLVWLLVANNAFNGLVISAVLKLADNIVRVFAHAAAMLFTMMLEAVFTSSTAATATANLLVSIVVVGTATVLYAQSGVPRPIRQAPDLVEMVGDSRACRTSV